MKKSLATSIVLNIVLLVVVVVGAFRVLSKEPADDTVEILVLTSNECEGAVEENRGGEQLLLTVSPDSGMPFEKAVVTLSEDTSFWTFNGSRIAVYPEHVIGWVAVEFHTIDAMKSGTAYFIADKVYCNGQ